MPFLQVRDVLARVREFHSSVSAYLKVLPEQAASDRVRLMIRYVAEHEDHFTRIVERYTENGNATILNTWIQFIPETKIDEVFEDVSLMPRDSVDEVIKTVAVIHHRVFELFGRIRAGSMSDQVHQLFDNLLVIEQQEDIERIKAALGICSL